MESLASQFSELADLKNDKNIDNNTNKDNNLKEKINYIQSMNETLRNQLKNLKTNIDIERIFISIIYQNLNQFVKDLEATGKNDNNIRMQTTKKGKQKKNNKRSDNKKQKKRCN